MSKRCSVCGREVKSLIKGMCTKHYNQYRKYGKVLDNNPRTKRDPNEIIIYDDYAEVILYRNNIEIARVLIDIEDIDKVKDYKWNLSHGYAYHSGTTKKIFMHRLIMNCNDDLVIDHINHDELDNRKSNLRLCTCQQNSMNNKLSKNKDVIICPRV